MKHKETVQKSDTFEIEPSELSDKTIEGLVEDAGFDLEDAQKYGDEKWFENLETPEPTKKETITEKISEKYSSWRKRSVFIEIKSVVRTEDDRIRLNLFHHKEGKRKVTFSPDSSVLGNIMSIADVHNPKELEGKQLLMTEGSSYIPAIVVPKNLSTYGRKKYKSYCLIEHIKDKFKMEDRTAVYLLGTLTLLGSILPLFVGPELPVVDTLFYALYAPLIIFVSLIILVNLMHGALEATLQLLSGEVSEVETDSDSSD